MQQEDKALQSTEDPSPDSRVAWRRLQMVLGYLESNIKAETLPQDPFCQHSGVERQLTNIYFRCNGCYHRGRPWAYMDCPFIDTTQSSGSGPAAPSCLMGMAIWEGLAAIRIVLLKDCRCSGRHSLEVRQTGTLTVQEENKSSSLQEEDRSLVHQRSSAQPGS